MQKGIIGKKIGMTQIFDQEAGKVIPVTVVEAGPCVVVQKKTVENDGYAALQIGFDEVKAQRISKPMKGHFDKSEVGYKRVLREFRLDDCDALNVGDLLKADTFAVGDIVDVSGTSKGKGTAGVIKRWNFSRLKETHGTGPVHRHGGSLGVIDPARVFKGKKMPGQMGSKKITIQNLEVVRVDAENNLLLVKGSVPGPKKSLVTIKESVKA